jgi:hypothetical protein
LMTDLVIVMLNHIAYASVNLGDMEMAKAYKDLARNVYEIINGEKDSFEMIYGAL